MGVLSGWVGGRSQGSLLTRQMEWVTGGSGDEEADPRFMNKCKHSGAQITAAGHLVWVGVPGRRWGPGRVGGGRVATSLQVQSNENEQVTGAFNCIYGKSYGRRLSGLVVDESPGPATGKFDSV